MTKQYGMDKNEVFIHQLISDSRVKYEVLDIDEVVRDLGRLNWIKQMLEMNNIDFNVLVTEYRNNLLAHLENI